MRKEERHEKLAALYREMDRQLKEIGEAFEEQKSLIPGYADDELLENARQAETVAYMAYRTYGASTAKNSPFRVPDSVPEVMGMFQEEMERRGLELVTEPRP